MEHLVGPLYDACRGGDAQTVQHVLDQFEALAPINWDPLCTLLCIACRNGHLEIVQRLVKRFAYDRENMFSAVIEAFMRGHFGVADWLVTNCELPPNTDSRLRRGYAYGATEAGREWIERRFGGLF